MKLLYVTSGVETFSKLDPNIIDAFTYLMNVKDNFDFCSIQLESIEQFKKVVISRKPDVIIVLKRRLPKKCLQIVEQLNIPIGLWVVDDPYLIKTHLQYAKGFQFIITQEESVTSIYEKKGYRVIYLPLAVNSNIYYPKSVSESYQSDICFVGSGLPNRIRVLQSLHSFLIDKKVKIIGRWWEPLKREKLFANSVLNETISPHETCNYYNGAKIVLNIHREKNDVKRNPYQFPVTTPNNRTFDIAACKSFQLSSFCKGMSSFYKKDEMIQFESPEELRDKLHYFLTHEGERKRIAGRGFIRTVKDHTYTVRLQNLLEMLKKKII